MIVCKCNKWPADRRYSLLLVCRLNSVSLAA